MEALFSQSQASLMVQERATISVDSFFYNFGTGTCTSDPRRLIFGQIILMGSGICRQLNWKNLAKRQKQKTIYFKIVGSKRRIWVQLGR